MALVDELGDPNVSFLQEHTASGHPQCAPPRERGQGYGDMRYAGVGVGTQLPQFGGGGKIYENIVIQDGLMVNTELVRSQYTNAILRSLSVPVAKNMDNLIPRLLPTLKSWEEPGDEAKTWSSSGRGIKITIR